MSWTSDPELQQMFVTELGERAARLVGGAQKMQTGEVDADLAGDMLREGHTIKGTGRVMGYEAISRAGQLIEQTWRRIQHEDIEPHRALGTALEDLASTLPSAASADPKDGTAELVAAIAGLNRVLSGGSEPPSDPPTPPSDPPTPPLADPEPEPEPDEGAEALVDPTPPHAPAAEPVAEERNPTADVIPLHPGFATQLADEGEPDRRAFGRARDVAAELGGLIGAVETWAQEETMNVNAGRLYRLINAIADIRNELDALSEGFAKELGGNNPVAEVTEDIADLQHDAVALAAVPISGMTSSLPQLVRYLAKKLDKDVRFEVVGDDQIAVDRQVLETISDPLRQLIVNAIRHGIEPTALRQKINKPKTGSVQVTMAVKDRKLEIVVSDDGAGIDWELVRTHAIDQGVYPASAGVDVDRLRQVLYAPGFTTVRASDLGGEGQGLCTVAEAVETLFGRMKLESTAGVGTTVTLAVPTSGALQRVLLVEESGSKWGIPEAVVDEIIPDVAVAIDWSADVPVIEWQERTIPVAPFGELVGTGGLGEPNKIVLLSHRLGEAAFTAERVIGVREVAVKELGPVLSGPSHVTGAALLGRGDVALVLDAGQLIERARGESQPTAPGARVLVVDDSVGARAVVSGALASSGFTTSVAGSVAEALEILSTEGADAVVVDFSMPQEDGIALVDEVRNNYSNLPVVMLSGVATTEDQNRAKEAGVDAFFEKADFREGALAETLRRMLEANGGTG